VADAIRYNLGLWHLGQGAHESAFRLLKSSLVTMKDEPNLWLRIIQSAVNLYHKKEDKHKHKHVGSSGGGGEAEGLDPEDLLRYALRCCENLFRLLPPGAHRKSNNNKAVLLAYHWVYRSYLLVQTKEFNHKKKTETWERVADLMNEMRRSDYNSYHHHLARAARYYTTVYLAQGAARKALEEDSTSHFDKREWEETEDKLLKCITMLDEVEEEFHTPNHIQQQQQGMLCALHVNLAHVQAKQHAYAEAEHSARKACNYVSPDSSFRDDEQNPLIESSLSLAYCQWMAGKTDSAIDTLSNQCTWCA
jgi:hypothetical protein